MKVRVYWNLHRRKWSIQQDGLVIGHKESVNLTDASFVVRRKGQERVRREGTKNVHAFAEGWYPKHYVMYMPQIKTDGRFVTYNPYKNDTFVYVDNGEPVGEVESIWLTTTAEGKPSVKVYS